jgi:hypothetical protein
MGWRWLVRFVNKSLQVQEGGRGKSSRGEIGKIGKNVEKSRLLKIRVPCHHVNSAAQRQDKAI